MDGQTDLPTRQPLAADLSELDDPAFLALCRTVRDAREATPRDQVSPELAEDYERVNREFMRRAGMAWQAP
jgi:hypothetical protein